MENNYSVSNRNVIIILLHCISISDPDGFKFWSGIENTTCLSFKLWKMHQQLTVANAISFNCRTQHILLLNYTGTLIQLIAIRNNIEKTPQINCSVKQLRMCSMMFLILCNVQGEGRAHVIKSPDQVGKAFQSFPVM